jgi:hypothetical protein
MALIIIERKRDEKHDLYVFLRKLFIDHFDVHDSKKLIVFD